MFIISLLGDAHHERLRDEDDELLQFAIQQSLIDSGTEADQVIVITFCHTTESHKSRHRSSSGNSHYLPLDRNKIRVMFQN